MKTGTSLFVDVDVDEEEEEEDGRAQRLKQRKFEPLATAWQPTAR